MFRVRMLLLVCVLGLTTSLQAQITYNAALDFSATNNPNGVWSYGQTTTLTGSPFVLYVYNSPDLIDAPPANLLNMWHNGPGGSYGVPAVMFNPTPSPLSAAGFTFQPGQLGLHPGPVGEYSVVRFTASYTTNYSLSATFRTLDPIGGSTDVHVLVNDIPIYNSEVDLGASDSFNAIVSLNAGDVVDFKVGWGSNMAYNSDSTGLDAVLIAAVPEPSTVLMVSGGLLGAGGIYWHRRRKAIQERCQKLQISR